jgi:hypothetical protein
MFGVMPWLQPADQIAVRKMAQLEFLSERLFIELRARGLLTESGEPRRLVGDFQRLISTMVSLLNALGMTPAGPKPFAIPRHRKVKPYHWYASNQG